MCVSRWKLGKLNHMINAGIIGLGRWGQNLVNSIQGKSDKIRITAGATRTVSKAADYAKQQGFPLHDSYQKVLADPKIDAVIVATPHTQRVEFITAAARSGKHVFTEKPLTLTKADADICVKACRDHNVTLAVGYNWRFQPALQEMKRMLDDGRLGKLLHIEGNFCGPSVYRFPQEFDPTSFERAFSARADITHRVNVRRFAGAKRASMRAHASQATGGGAASAGEGGQTGDRTLAAFLRIPRPVYDLVFGREWFRDPALPPGHPVRTDIFEGER